MIALMAEWLFAMPDEASAETPAPAPPARAAHVVAEVTVGTAVTAAAVLPAFLGFAEPTRRGAAARVLAKQLAGVLLCGALLALGNFIFTWCSVQWAQAGLPVDLPLLVSRPGGGVMPPGATTQAGGNVRINLNESPAPSKNEWSKYVD